MTDKHRERVLKRRNKLPKDYDRRQQAIWKKHFQTDSERLQYTLSLIDFFHSKGISTEEFILMVLRK